MALSDSKSDRIISVNFVIIEVSTLFRKYIQVLNELTSANWSTCVVIGLRAKKKLAVFKMEKLIRFHEKAIDLCIRILH